MKRKGCSTCAPLVAQLAAERDRAIEREKLAMERADRAEQAAWQEFAILPPLAPTGGGVYFIQCEGTGRVKIGYAQSISARLHHITTGNPHGARLVGVIFGAGKGEEGELHRRFHHLHHRGEWFRGEPELLSYVRSLPRAPARPRGL